MRKVYVMMCYCTAERAILAEYEEGICYDVLLYCRACHPGRIWGRSMLWCVIVLQSVPSWQNMTKVHVMMCYCTAERAILAEYEEGLCYDVLLYCRACHPGRIWGRCMLWGSCSVCHTWLPHTQTSSVPCMQKVSILYFIIHLPQLPQVSKDSYQKV